MPLYLTEANVTSLLAPADALEAVEGSFLRLAAGAVENRPRERLRLEDGSFAVMAAVDSGQSPMPVYGAPGVAAAAGVANEARDRAVTVVTANTERILLMAGH